jgi:hypothetical protein
MPKPPTDPYAPPPMKRDSSGAVVRIGVIGLLLAGAVWGYTTFSANQQTAFIAPPAEEQQFAEAAPAVAPAFTPPAETAPTPPEPAPAAAPAARRAAPAAAPPAPVTTPEPAASPPAPITTSEPTPIAP